jgi:hypothetical protein
MRFWRPRAETGVRERWQLGPHRAIGDTGVQQHHPGPGPDLVRKHRNRLSSATARSSHSAEAHDHGPTRRSGTSAASCGQVKAPSGHVAPLPWQRQWQRNGWGLSAQPRLACDRSRRESATGLVSFELGESSMFSSSSSDGRVRSVPGMSTSARAADRLGRSMEPSL